MVESFEFGEMVAFQGKEGCTDWRCTRMFNRLEDGTIEMGECIGWHCPKCGEPCSMMGHKVCPEVDDEYGKTIRIESD